MQKKDIAHRVHQEAGISEDEAASLVDWLLELLKTTLRHGEPLVIHNFGVFTVRNKAPRKGRNPKTGQPVIISSRRVVTFRASAHLKGEVNSV